MMALVAGGTLNYQGRGGGGGKEGEGRRGRGWETQTHMNMHIQAYSRIRDEGYCNEYTSN